jgi:hypothetical protein
MEDDEEGKTYPGMWLKASGACRVTQGFQGFLGH